MPAERYCGGSSRFLYSRRWREKDFARVRRRLSPAGGLRAGKEAYRCFFEVSCSPRCCYRASDVAQAQGRRDTTALAQTAPAEEPAVRRKRNAALQRRAQAAHCLARRLARLRRAAAESQQPLASRQRLIPRARRSPTSRRDSILCRTTAARNGATTTSAPTRPGSPRPIGPSRRFSIGSCARPATKPGTRSP